MRFETPDHRVVRFWQQVIPTEGCWHWTGATNSNGYGAFGLSRKSQSAHRSSFVMKHGYVPEGMDVHHTCNNRLCVNPDHLVAVTHKENVLAGSSLSAKNAAMKDCQKCGRPLSGDNLRVESDGGKKRRRCGYCRKVDGAKRMAAWRLKKRLERTQEV